jgi:hypothetical protein
MWNQLKSGALSSHLLPPVLSWWTGWNSAGPNAPAPQLSMTIRRGDQWTDIFFGDAQHTHRHSLLDGKAKVALHYCTSDLEQIAQMACPMEEIPEHLWRQLKQQRPATFRYSFTSQRFHG